MCRLVVRDSAPKLVACCSRDLRAMLTSLHAIFQGSHESTVTNFESAVFFKRAKSADSRVESPANFRLAKFLGASASLRRGSLAVVRMEKSGVRQLAVIDGKDDNRLRTHDDERHRSRPRSCGGRS